MATAIREVGVWRQTRTLLLKNYLVKCRTKKSSVQEILFPLFFLFWLILISMMHPNKKYEEVPDIELNPMDKSILSNLILGYTPVTNITSNIMQKVSADHLPDVIIIEEYTNEKEMVDSSLSKSSNFVGVVFKDLMSYELRFFPDMIPVSSAYMDSRVENQCFSLEGAGVNESCNYGRNFCCRNRYVSSRSNFNISSYSIFTFWILFGNSYCSRKRKKAKRIFKDNGTS